MSTKSKKAIADVLKVVAGIGAVVFLLAPVGTWNGVLLCVVSVFVAIICGAISGNLDDEEAAKSGYWPPKPDR